MKVKYNISGQGVTPILAYDTVTDTIRLVSPTWKNREDDNPEKTGVTPLPCGIHNIEKHSSRTGCTVEGYLESDSYLLFPAGKMRLPVGPYQTPKWEPFPLLSGVEVAVSIGNPNKLWDNNRPMLAWNNPYSPDPLGGRWPVLVLRCVTKTEFNSTSANFLAISMQPTDGEEHTRLSMSALKDALATDSIPWRSVEKMDAFNYKYRASWKFALQRADGSLMKDDHRYSRKGVSFFWMLPFQPLKYAVTVIEGEVTEMGKRANWARHLGLFCLFNEYQYYAQMEGPMPIWAGRDLRMTVGVDPVWHWHEKHQCHWKVDRNGITVLAYDKVENQEYEIRGYESLDVLIAQAKKHLADKIASYKNAHMVPEKILEILAKHNPVITALDSEKAGNCRVGILRFCAEHNLPPEGLPFSQLRERSDWEKMWANVAFRHTLKNKAIDLEGQK